MPEAPTSVWSGTLLYPLSRRHDFHNAREMVEDGPADTIKKSNALAVDVGKTVNRRGQVLVPWMIAHY